MVGKDCKDSFILSMLFLTLWQTPHGFRQSVKSLSYIDQQKCCLSLVPSTPGFHFGDYGSKLKICLQNVPGTVSCLQSLPVSLWVKHPFLLMKLEFWAWLKREEYFPPPPGSCISYDPSLTLPWTALLHFGELPLTFLSVLFPPESLLHQTSVKSSGGFRWVPVLLIICLSISPYTT